MKTGIYRNFLVGVAALASSAVASASIIYSDFDHEGSDTVDYRVEVSHNQTAGLFDISYEVTNSASVGKFSGFFFDLSSDYNASNIGLTNEFTPSGASVCGMGFGVKKVKGSKGCNSNLNEGTFDVGLAWKTNDLTVAPFVGSFSISDLGHLALEDWGKIGMRAQDVNGGGSAKEVQFTPDVSAPPVAASEPGTIALIGLGFMGLIMSRRSQRKH